MKIVNFASTFHVFYVDNAGNLIHQQWNGSAWIPETLATGCDATRQPDAEVMSNGALAVAALDNSGNLVWHGRFPDQTTWS